MSLIHFIHYHMMYFLTNRLTIIIIRICERIIMYMKEARWKEGGSK